MEGVLDQSYRIDEMIIVWKYSPRVFKIEIGDEVTNYISAVDWRDPSEEGRTTNRLKNLMNRYFDNENYSFPIKIEFDYPFFGSKIRIQMKNPVNGSFFGIERLELYSREIISVIKLKKRKEEDPEKCLVASESEAKRGTHIHCKKYSILF